MSELSGPKRLAEVRLSGQAEIDLVNIGAYGVQRWGSDASANFVAGFYETFELLEMHADIGRPRDEVRNGLRSWLHRAYVVFYSREGEVVTIRRIVHGATDPTSVIPSL